MAIRQPPRVSGVDPRVARIVEPIRSALQALSSGPTRAVRLSDLGPDFRIVNGKIRVKAPAAAATTTESSGGSQIDVDALVAAISDAQTDVRRLEQQLLSVASIATDQPTLLLDSNSFVVGYEDPGEDEATELFGVRADHFGFVRPAPQWQPEHEYSLGEYVTTSDEYATGLIFEVTTAGTSGATEPEWPDEVDETVESGTVVFTARENVVHYPFITGTIGGNPDFGIDGSLLIDSSVAYEAIEDATALSVLGRASDSSGVLADIAAASDHQILRRSGSSIGFGSINLASSAAVGTSRLAFSNIAQITGPAVLGVAPAAAGNLGAIAASANDTLLRRTSDELSWGQLTSGMFPEKVVPDAALSSNVALYDGDVSQFSNGTFADGRIAESNVTQHQAALAIDWSQLTSVPSTFPPSSHTHSADDVTSGTLPVSRGGTGRTSLTSGALLVGAGSSAIVGVNVGTAGQVVRSTGSAWAAATLSFSDLGSVPAMVSSLGALSDPDADRIVFWDDSADALAFLEIGTGLEISGTSLQLTSAAQNALTLAATALQPGDNISDLTNDTGYITGIGGFSIGDLADVDIGTPGSGEDGYALVWDNDEGEFVLAPVSGGGGTVTSVAVSVPTGFTVTGSPITSSGTIEIEYDTGYQGFTSAEAALIASAVQPGDLAAVATSGDFGDLSDVPAMVSSLASLSDPNADRIVFWDDSAGVLAWLSLASGELAISGTTLGVGSNVALYDGDVSQFSNGTFADGRIAESNVTQHQAALAIDWSQLTSVPSMFPPSSHTHSAADLSGVAKLTESNVFSGLNTFVLRNSPENAVKVYRENGTGQYHALYGDSGANWLTSFSALNNTKPLILRATTNEAGDAGTLEPYIELRGRSNTRLARFDDNAILFNKNTSITGTLSWGGGDAIASSSLVARRNAHNEFTGRVVSKDSFELHDDTLDARLLINISTGGRIYFAPWYNGAYNFQREFGFDPAVEKWYAEGGLTDASITQSSVKQHEAALSIAWLQLTGLPAYATRWPSWSEVSDKPSTFPPSSHTHSASDITTGTLSDARLSPNVPLKDAPNTFSNQVPITGSHPASTYIRRADTTGVLVLLGGTNNSRELGALINLYGADHPNSPGALLIYAGTGGTLDLAGETIRLNNVNVTDYARLSQQNPFTGTTQTVSAANANWLATNGTVGVKIQALSTNNTGLVGTQTNHELHFIVNNTSRASIDTSGVFRYGPYEIGYRDIPTYPGGGSVRGTVLVVSTNQTISTGFATNSTFAYYNNSSSSITITQGSGLTLRLAGTSLTGNRTLAARGWATVWFLSETEAIISGPGVS